MGPSKGKRAYKNSNVKIYPILLPRYITRRSRQRHTRANSQRITIQFDGLEHHSTMQSYAISFQKPIMIMDKIIRGLRPRLFTAIK